MAESLHLHIKETHSLQLYTFGRNQAAVFQVLLATEGDTRAFLEILNFLSNFIILGHSHGQKYLKLHWVLVL